MANLSGLGRRRNFALVILVLGLAALALAYVLEFPQGTYAAAKNVHKFNSQASLLDGRLCRCAPDREVQIVRDDGLAIAGSLYGSDNVAGRPGVLLLHGNTPLGRKLPLYRVLSAHLADRGYPVLSIDFTGYGQSDDPFSLGGRLSFNGDKDVLAALEYLKALDNVNGDNIHVVGHSGGSTSALSVGIDASEVKSIILIGPPRRTAERMLDQDDRDYFWERANSTRQKVYGIDFPSWYTQEVWLEQVLDSDMARYLDYLSQPQHKPMLLIDGENESMAGREYLQAYYDSMAEPKRYVTISESDHYANSMSAMGLALYDRKAVAAHVGEIDHWISSFEE